MNHQCRNCQAEITGPYCQQCGQKQNDGRIYFKDIWQHIVDEVLAVDGPLLNTIRGLTVAPAELCRRYIGGERIRYTKPLQYFLMMFIFYFLVSHLLNFDSIAVQFKAMGMDKLPAESIGRRIGEFTSKYINFFYTLYIPLFAALSRFFYRKNGYYFAEYVAIGFYVIGHFIFVATFFVFLSYIDIRIFFYSRVVLLIYSVWLLTQLDQNGHIVSRLSKSL
ncbi:MAG: DUF3667 domain-containing protein, partial [Calditrichaeota bacterium]|nr:DUF3667 domain-containing protein [Calditrichota bacterium]